MANTEIYKKSAAEENILIFDINIDGSLTPTKENLNDIQLVDHEIVELNDVLQDISNTIPSSPQKCSNDENKFKIPSNVPSPFKQLYKPLKKKNEVQKRERRVKDRIPAALTSDEWNKFHEIKEENKRKNEEEKLKKKEERLKIRKIKEEKMELAKVARKIKKEAAEMAKKERKGSKSKRRD